MGKGTTTIITMENYMFAELVFFEHFLREVNSLSRGVRLAGRSFLRLGRLVAEPPLRVLSWFVVSPNLVRRVRPGRNENVESPESRWMAHNVHPPSRVWNF